VGAATNIRKRVAQRRIAPRSRDWGCFASMACTRRTVR
jgi:hypothetical protein